MKVGAGTASHVPVSTDIMSPLLAGSPELAVATGDTVLEGAYPITVHPLDIAIVASQAPIPDVRVVMVFDTTARLLNTTSKAAALRAVSERSMSAGMLNKPHEVRTEQPRKAVAKVVAEATLQVPIDEREEQLFQASVKSVPEDRSLSPNEERAVQSDQASEKLVTDDNPRVGNEVRPEQPYQAELQLVATGVAIAGNEVREEQEAHAWSKLVIKEKSPPEATLTKLEQPVKALSMDFH